MHGRTGTVSLLQASICTFGAGPMMYTGGNKNPTPLAGQGPAAQKTVQYSSAKWCWYVQACFLMHMHVCLCLYKLKEAYPVSLSKLPHDG